MGPDLSSNPELAPFQSSLQAVPERLEASDRCWQPAPVSRGDLDSSGEGVLSREDFQGSGVLR